MKKVLLSSIIMFAVCGYATAQNATDSKFKKAETTTTSAAPTPQKAAVTNDLGTQPQPASDKAAQAVAPVATGKSAKTKPTETNAVGADGVKTASDAAQKQEIEKAEAAKAANAKKNKENN